MSIAILALLSWLVLIVFAIIPKGFTLIEIIFLYFLIVILTITPFTILDINLQWVPLTHRVEESFAMYIDRFILIPFQILMAVCVLQSHLPEKRKWGLLAAIVVLLCIEDRIYLWADLITYQKWNEFYSALMYVSFIAVTWYITRRFIGLKEGEFEST